MRQAESDYTPDPSRRAVIRGGGKVAATLAVPAAPTGDDAEIIELGREVFRCEAVTGSDAVIERAVETMARLSKRIAGLKATTFAALAVKLRIAAIGDDLDGEFYSYDQMNLLSAIADAERMAEAEQ